VKETARLCRKGGTGPENSKGKGGIERRNQRVVEHQEKRQTSAGASTICQTEKPNGCRQNLGRRKNNSSAGAVVSVARTKCRSAGGGAGADRTVKTGKASKRKILPEFPTYEPGTTLKA